MKPPGFWNHPESKPGLLAVLLSPISAVWTFLTHQRMARGSWHRLPVPVICVGNINLGGTGKTPTVIALCDHLRAKGLEPQVISRGYGGSLAGPVLVDEKQHTADQVGDEPLLLAAFTPTWVARDRHAGALAAIAAGADCVVLDDGLQNPALDKDVSIAVVDARVGFGNGRVFPAGPLRQTLADGLKRVDLVLSVGEPAAQKEFSQMWGGQLTKPQITAELELLETGMDWAGTRVLAFAGIGRPEKFFATLRSLGANIVRSESLSDHQKLPDRLIKRLEAEALLLDAQLVTTEKDAVRLPAAFRTKVITLPVRLNVPDWGIFDEALATER